VIDVRLAKGQEPSRDMSGFTPLLIEFVYHDDIVVVVPQASRDRPRRDLYVDELKSAQESLSADERAKYVVLDLEQIDCLNSALLGFIVTLWKTAQARGGKMVMCGVLAGGKNVLKVANLNTLWPIVASRQEAIEAVRRG
jgi:anti-anti-sigma factor